MDVCHAYGMAVLLDVVYNHAGGDFGDESLYFFDRQKTGNNNDSQYFTDQGWAGGLVFAFWKREVRQFLIDNAKLLRGGVPHRRLPLRRGDGDRHASAAGGSARTSTGPSTPAHAKLPEIAEYWDPDQAPVLRPPDQGGAGFDAVWQAGLREAVREAIGQAAHGREAHVNLDAVRDHLYPVPNFAAAWRAVQHLENHDIVYAGHGDRVPRIAALGDSSNARSIW